eukprot:TRINITY_DN82_c0_g3_i2.p1 TRINITY_DN82_c0_g3~~TRINITY_DN82_c0_g3_i2.p1  ORF type:complete len:211 (-),score=29.73 TRINITY_DN82_c0_g3_i2:309-941(-)
MMILKVVLFGLLGVSGLGQTVTQVQAQGSTPSGSSGQAEASASGQFTTADAIVQVTSNAVISSATATATSSAVPKPAPKPKPSPKPKKLRCEDIKNDQCPNIDKFDKCAFCITNNNPNNLKGFGVTFQKYYHKGVINILPSKECKGKLIFEGKDCPKKKKALTCDDYNKCIKKCKDTKQVKVQATIVLQTSQTCLSSCKLTDAIFKKCFH